MRDPKRIDELLAALRQIWVMDPDLRLGQLAVIATRPKNPCPEVFHVEDDKILEGLRDYAKLKGQGEDDFGTRAAKAELLNATNQLRAIAGYPPLVTLPEPPFCSFCGRSKSEMGALVEGLDAFICVECAAAARRALVLGSE